MLGSAKEAAADLEADVAGRVLGIGQARVM
ncbi:hypothetical protein QG37_05100 [Candidozyma auris]|nr:hypothetical protein QG37_05100 [[Candida] auris]